MNMEISENVTLNQLSVRGFYIQIKVSKNKEVSRKTSFFCDRPILCSPFYFA